MVIDAIFTNIIPFINVRPYQMQLFYSVSLIVFHRFISTTKIVPLDERVNKKDRPVKNDLFPTMKLCYGLLLAQLHDSTTSISGYLHVRRFGLSDAYTVKTLIKKLIREAAEGFEPPFSGL